MDEIDTYLKEDLGDVGDITSESLFSNETAKGKIICKEDCVIAGLEESKEVFERIGVEINLIVDDGNEIKKGTVVAEVSGFASAILKGERLALNFIGRMSGIATETKRLVDSCRKINPNINIAATRKTTPGFRKYEKKAVVIGGGEPHRSGLYDVVMIKDNHIKLFGSVEGAIRKIQQKVKDKIIEVEVENEKDAVTAAELNVDVIMLDNFKPEEAIKAYKKIKEISPKILVEISGGVTQKNILEYSSFADRVSLGYLTHSVKSTDFSLEIL
jgi:nicotinate-nucleotide pyrophosphorylase (carboxylating)